MPGRLPREILSCLRSSPTIRWIVGVTALAVTLLWATTAAYMAFDRDRAIRGSESRVAAAVTLLTAHANRSFESARASLIVLDSWLADEQYGLRPLHMMESLITRLRGFDGEIPDIRLFDETGRIFDMNGGVPSDESVANREFFSHLAGRHPGEIVVGAPFVSRYTGTEIIPILTRASPNRHGIAFLGLGIPSRIFTDAYEAARPKDGGVTALFRADATLLARAPTAGTTPGQRMPQLQLFAAGYAQQPSGTYRADLNGRARIAAFAGLPEFGLIVVSSTAIDAVLSDWREGVVMAVAVLLAVTAAMAAGCFYIVRLFRAREAEFRRTREALAQAAAANQVKSDFLAKMSHELHTPLNAILGFSEVIAGAVLGPLSAPYRQYGGDIHASGKHLLNLVDAILNASMAENGRAHLAEETVDLCQAAEAALETERQACAMAGLATEIRIAEDARFLLADGRLIRRMLANLVSNAVKFSNPGGAVTLSSRLTGEGLALEVRDTGIGMPPGALAHVFEPFGRGDSFVAREAAGLGLGLPDTKSLIALHGGRIEIDSAPGAGTRVVLHFPTARVAPLPAPAPVQMLG